LAIQLFVSFSAAGIYTASMAMKNINSVNYGELAEEVKRWAVNNTNFLVLISNIICLAPFLPIWLITRKRTAQYRIKNPALVFAFIFFIFIGFNMTLEFLLSTTDVVRYFPTYDFVSEAIAGGNIFVRFLALVIAAPLVEEMCFRGVILSRLLAWTPPWAAVTVQAVLFGLVHMNLLQGIYAFILGAILGFIYTRFRKLRFCIAGHMAFNFVAFVIILIQEKGIGIPIPAFIPGVMIFALCGYYLLKLPVADTVLEINNLEGREIS